MTQKVALGELALSLQDGPFGSNLKSSHYVGCGVRVIRLQNIGVGYFDDRDRAFVSTEHFERLRRHDCRPGDVLIATLGDPIIRACLQPPSLEIALNKADCLRLRCDPRRVLPEYVVHFLNSGAARAQTMALAHGQTRARVNLGQVRSLIVPLPPLDEQRRIAQVLDRVQAVAEARRRAIAALAQLPHALLSSETHEATSGVATQPLGEVLVDIRIGPFGSALHRADYIDDGIPLINPMHIVDGRIAPQSSYSVTTEKAAELSSYWLRSGDVVMGRRGEMGRCAVVTHNADGYICGTGSMILRADHDVLDPVYLQAVLSSSEVKRELGRASLGATLPNLNKGIVGDLKISIPERHIQATFVEAVRRIDDLLDVLKHHLAAAEELARALQSRAFMGKL